MKAASTLQCSRPAPWRNNFYPQGLLQRRELEYASRHGMAPLFTDSDEHPSFADATADFIHARLMRSRSDLASGYPDAELQTWASRLRTWATDATPDELPMLTAPGAAPRRRDVFVFFIAAAKERNPGAATALLRMLGARRD